VLLAHNTCVTKCRRSPTSPAILLHYRSSVRTDADVIVFCGVHFMAESAAILSPARRCLLPRPDAGCPMADMVTAEELRRSGPNTPACRLLLWQLAAEVQGPFRHLLTSANALKVVRSLREGELIFVPDRNLGRWIAVRPEKKFHLSGRFCPTHERMTVAAVLAEKAEHPGALFICHPESGSGGFGPGRPCLAPPAACTTIAAPARPHRFIIGTEAGILY